MKVSYSRVETFKQCPRKYKYRYIDNLKVIPDQRADNALYLGSALHKGIETTVEEGILEYTNNFYVLTDSIINWTLQLEYWVSKVKEILPDNGNHEVKIETDDYIGFIDYVTKDTIYDFKFTLEKNQHKYFDSPQLSIYKYYYEQIYPENHIDHLKYIFVPKVAIRQKKTETIQQFRKRLCESMDKLCIKVAEVPFDNDGITQFLNERKQIETVSDYPKRESKLCDYCDYYKYCLKGEDWTIYEN